MNTVARGLILPIVDWARSNGYSSEDLFRGMRFDEAALRTDVRRLEWADYVELHERLAREVGGIERLTALIETLPTPSIDWLLRSLDSPVQIYRMWSHLSPLLWGSLRMEVEEGPNGRIRLAVSLPDDAPDATTWFRVCTGLIAGMPTRLGLPRAGVEVLHIGPHAAEWFIQTAQHADPPGNGAPADTLAYVTDMGEAYGQAMRELEEARRRLADPTRDFEDRIQSATSAWQLTPAQALVLRGVVRGLSNKEIASELGNAEATVEVHVTRLLRKAGAGGRTALVTRFWGGARMG